MPLKRRKQGRVLATKATHAMRQGRLDQAEALARLAQEAAPRDPNVLRLLASIALLLHDPATAGDRLALAIAHHAAPAPSEWHHALGEILTLQGKLDQAIPAFRSAVALTPETTELSRIIRDVGTSTAAGGLAGIGVEPPPLEGPEPPVPDEEPVWELPGDEPVPDADAPVPDEPEPVAPPEPWVPTPGGPWTAATQPPNPMSAPASHLAKTSFPCEPCEPCIPVLFQAGRQLLFSR